MSRSRIPERRRREIAAQQRERDERYGQRVDDILGLEGADPVEVYEWTRRLRQCLYADARFWCLTCGPRRGGLVIEMEPDTPCAGCGRGIGTATGG